MLWYLRGAAVVALAAGMFSLGSSPKAPEPLEAPEPLATIGNAKALAAAYDRWKAAERRAGRERLLVLPLGYSKGLSARATEAQGRIVLDLADGSLRAEVSGYGAEGPLELWLVDNWPGPGRSVRPEPGDDLILLGRLAPAGETAVLETRIDPAAVAGFEIDLVVAAEPGRHPGEGGILFGAPGLFQKLRAQRLASGAADSAAVIAGAPFGALVPSPAFAQSTTGRGGFAKLVAEGEALFFEETFDGNGRTCGTCHPAENNFTIDPAFIATLPDDDPLFVAEFNPDLAENFENPRLMRKFGLILENVDGFEDLENKFTMRGVPHTLALATSLDASDEDLENGFPVQRTGWSADGAPGTGSLREFAIGAVTQHFPKTLGREAGIDFRLPTDRELDALEAFQLSLGRQEDPDLATLVLSDADAAAGQVLFAGAAFCNGCHLNAGANFVLTPDVNENFDTDTEELIKGQRKHRPVDGGFGRDPAPDGGFGDGKFNTPTLVEAADTAPYFHNNTGETLEEAVAFYATDVFNNSPAGRLIQPFTPGGAGIVLDDLEVAQIGAFLRVINALENARAASDLADRAKQGNDAEASARLLGLALAETEDATEVLTAAMDGAGVHGADAVPHLEDAAFLLGEAQHTARRRDRKFLIDEALAELEAAKAAMMAEVS